MIIIFILWLVHNSQSSVGKINKILWKTLSGKGQWTNKNTITMPITLYNLEKYSFYKDK